jgi:hypothetical protein
MRNCNPCATPMEARLKLSMDSASLAMDHTEFRSLIGSLRYVLHAIPFLTFSVCYLSQFMEEPKKEQMVAIKRVMRYIPDTTEFGLIHPRRSGGNMELLGYSDNDIDGDIDDSRSTLGAIFFLGEGSVTWST